MVKSSFEHGSPLRDSLQKQQAYILSLECLRQFSITSVEPVEGGVSHYVYLLTLEGGKRLYVKKRADHFSRLPDITSRPEDIVYEFKALKIFHSLQPQHFPEIVAFDQMESVLVLTDALPNDDDSKLEELFLQRRVDKNIIATLGSSLARIHACADGYVTPLRNRDDSAHYQLKLAHRLGSRKLPILEWAIDRLHALPHKQLILGDPAPKNIGINGGGTNCVFFDLEEAHLGDPIFDYAYLLGHIIVHSLGEPPQKLVENIATFESSYDAPKKDLQLSKAIALGTVLYRLKSRIPYPLNISPQQRELIDGSLVETLQSPNVLQQQWIQIVRSFLS